MKLHWVTKCIVHSGLVVNLSDVALIGLRQIYRFDYFKGGKFGSLGNLNFIALKSATKPYISRYGQLALHEKSIRQNRSEYAE